MQAIPRTPEIVQETLRRLGFDYRLPDNMTQDKLDELFESLGDTESRSGDGMKTAGEGTGTNPTGSDTSVGNTENGGSD